MQRRLVEGDPNPINNFIAYSSFLSMQDIKSKASIFVFCQILLLCLCEVMEQSFVWSYPCKFDEMRLNEKFDFKILSGTRITHTHTYQEGFYVSKVRCVLNECHRKGEIISNWYTSQGLFDFHLSVCPLSLQALTV